MTHAAFEPVSPASGRLDRAVGLFQFLTRAQQLKNPPVRTLDSYDSVIWLADLPQHEAVRTIDATGGAEAPMVVVDRLQRVDPPEPNALLAANMTGLRDDPEQPPELTDPELAAPYEQWLLHWRIWAARERLDRPVRTLYGELFSLYKLSTGSPEQLELLAGIGCLAWRPPDHPPVRRHLLTAPVTIAFDAETGQLAVVRSESMGALSVELDMLDPGFATSQHIDAVRTAAEDFDGSPFDVAAVGPLVRRLVHTLDPNGAYSPDLTPPAFSDRAVAAFAPALILRRRSQLGLVDVFRRIQAQLTESGQVPDGIVPLVDPDYRPQVAGDRSDGALVTVDDDMFLPLPVNDVQVRILRHVDTHAQTLVQGPPGTGKTHTAAALLSHLLAQGKRVLVTAHTDRALKEVRDKLPAAIKPLSVAVVGSSRAEMADLKTSIEHIVSAAADHDEDRAARIVEQTLANIEALGVRRADLYHELLDGRQNELRTYEHAGYSGTLATIAREHHAARETYEWLLAWVQPAADAAPPISTPDIATWYAYLVDPALIADEPESRRRLPAADTVPEPAHLAELLSAELAATSRDGEQRALTTHPAYPAIRRLDGATRMTLQARLRDLVDTADDLARRREVWMSEALGDVRSGRLGIWANRARSIGELIIRAEPPVLWLGPRVNVRVTMPDLALLARWADELQTYLAGGGKLKAEAGGPPKIGAFAPKNIKATQPFFDHVRIDGAIPTTQPQLAIFLAWVDAALTLDALDRAWPQNVRVPVEDTLHERLQWHKTEFASLQQLLAFGTRLDTEARQMAAIDLPRPDWTDLDSVRGYARVVDAATTADAAAAAARPLYRLDTFLAAEAQWDDVSPAVPELLDALRRRDRNAYATAYARLVRLWDVRRTTAHRDTLAKALATAAPALAAAVLESPDDPAWPDRIGDFERAWRWAATGAWLHGWATSNVNALQGEVIATEERIRAQVETLAATRAWTHALAADRLTGSARANLTQYAQLVRSLGKGTGKYAELRRADIRQALDRCRPSVPVWIMPIYRIAEQFQVQPDMFDIVIVDEASQAGLEATFLQYLAPKMVVIGDDKQVSPTAVGVDQQHLRDLARQYLADDPYRASWEDPQRSLFDEAKMRYSGMLTLVEHRRCVPEIIGFSNRIAYEPEGIRLVPVRQYGADRLEPIKVVHVANGFTRGTTNRINPPEVDAIVDQIEKCIADPHYDGMTFGVISLLGAAQAKAIEQALLERVPASEWQARDLRCGDSSDFQGSERNVMFLSMVAAPEPGKRSMPLTANRYVQRYNVAASRAKDQMWLFHTLDLGDVTNPDDMRFALLDYCYAIARRGSVTEEGVRTTAVAEDVRVVPFDSLFEQRVFNRLVDRGYSVIPQFESQGYRIDLVVVGAKARLAIECDGDAWHGPEAYERDLARQRDLERCGWQFFRIRETEFYVDGPAVFEQLWDTLHQLDIHPSGWVDPASIEEAEKVDEAEKVEETAEIEPLDQLPTADVDAATYDEFDAPLVPPLTASPEQLRAGILAILSTEGPIVGQRLNAVYVRAAGLHKVGRLLAEALANAIGTAVGDGQIIEDNPLDAATTAARTYRLPDQDPIRVRTLGPRSFDEIPPAELSALLASAADRYGWDNEETLFRAVLDRLGLKRLTTGVHERLREVLPLARNRTDR